MRVRARAPTIAGAGILARHPCCPRTRTSGVLVNPRAVAAGGPRPMMQWLAQRSALRPRCVVAEGVAAAAEALAAMSAARASPSSAATARCKDAAGNCSKACGRAGPGKPLGNDTARALGLAGWTGLIALAHALDASATPVDPARRGSTSPRAVREQPHGGLRLGGRPARAGRVARALRRAAALPVGDAGESPRCAPGPCALEADGALRRRPYASSPRR